MVAGLVTEVTLLMLQCYYNGSTGETVAGISVVVVAAIGGVVLRLTVVEAILWGGSDATVI